MMEKKRYFNENVSEARPFVKTTNKLNERSKLFTYTANLVNDCALTIIDLPGVAWVSVLSNWGCGAALASQYFTVRMLCRSTRSC